MLNADFRAAPRRPIQSIVDHGGELLERRRGAEGYADDSLVMSQVNEQGHSAIRKRQQAFALRLASINETTRKALGAREPTVENLVRAFRRNMGLATKVSHQLVRVLLDAREPDRPERRRRWQKRSPPRARWRRRGPGRLPTLFRAVCSSCTTCCGW